MRIMDELVYDCIDVSYIYISTSLFPLMLDWWMDAIVFMVDLLYIDIPIDYRDSYDDFWRRFAHMLLMD